MSQKQSHLDFIKIAAEKYGDGAIITRPQVEEIVNAYDIAYPFWLTSKDVNREGRGQYRLPLLADAPGLAVDTATDSVISPASVTRPKTQTVSSAPTSSVQHTSEPAQILRRAQLHDESIPTIPMKRTGYVPFGFYQDMRTIVSRLDFFPVMITGMSGNGKTLMVLQSAAVEKRSLIRVNISPETDQIDLLGGPEIVNGNTVNRDGPVLLAMKHGSILLLDEIDRGTDKLMCLQSIMEGEPFFNKNTGEMIYPKKGFNIIATANTKGKGSEDGRYLAKILDDAFLERFPITVEQDYPTEKTEAKILENALEAVGKPDSDFIAKLTSWATIIRKAFKEGSCDELISTRRLVDICHAYAIYGDRMKAITLCTNRFDDQSKESFLEFYSKIDETLNQPKETTVGKEMSLGDVWAQEIETQYNN